MKNKKLTALNKSLTEISLFIMDNNDSKLEFDQNKVKIFITLLANLQEEISVYNRHLLYVLINESDPAFRIKQEVLEEPAFVGMVRESEAQFPQDAPKPADMLKLRAKDLNLL